MMGKCVGMACDDSCWSWLLLMVTMDHRAEQVVFQNRFVRPLDSQFVDGFGLMGMIVLSLLTK